MAEIGLRLAGAEAGTRAPPRRRGGALAFEQWKAALLLADAETGLEAAMVLSFGLMGLPHPTLPWIEA